MSLNIVSLASGSKGNCTLIYSDNTAILCDVGISYARILDGLEKYRIPLNAVKGIVITHEHSDHIAALPKIARFVPVYAHPLTAQAIYERQGELNNYNGVDFYESGFSIGDIKVEPFRIPHDAAYPLGYSFACEKKRASIATDMGVPLKSVLNNISGSQVVILESNHDVEMLKNGSYAYPLKQRILSKNGHLSNDDAGMMAQWLVGTSVEHLVLGHLSENNNTPDLAYNTVKRKIDALRAKGEINLSLASQSDGSQLFEL